MKGIPLSIKTLAQGSTLLFIANIAAGVLNYAFHPITARYLSPGQFGLLESFVALNYILAVAASSYALTIIHFYNQYPKNQRSHLLPVLQKNSIKITYVSWTIALLLIIPAKLILNIDNPYLLLVFSIQILFSFIPAVYTSILQSQLQFNRLSLIIILSPVLKLMLTLAFLYFGLQVLGALAGLTLSSLVSLILSYAFTRTFFPHEKTDAAITHLPNQFWRHYWPIFLTQVGFTSLYNTDIVLIRLFFPASLVGIYAAAAMIARSILFASTNILTVAFPLFASNKNSRLSLRQIYSGSLAGIILISIFGFSVFSLYPMQFVAMLYGPGYQDAAALMPFTAVLMSMLSLYYLNYHFLIITNPHVIMWLSTTTAAVHIVSILLLHASLVTVIKISLVVILVTLIVSWRYIYKDLYVAKT